MKPKRYKRWKFVYWLAHGFLTRLFYLEAERLNPIGPCLIIANHVTNWDPLLLAMSFPDTPIRFVASEHIFRHGLISKLLEWLVAPIPRKKAASGADTVMSVLRALKAGDTVCIFAEGDATWDGLTHPVCPATGKLARMAGVPLLTYRIEGGYLAVLLGKIVFLDAAGAFCWLDYHRADLYSPSTWNSSIKGRTAASACWYLE